MGRDGHEFQVAEDFYVGGLAYLKAHSR